MSGGFIDQDLWDITQQYLNDNLHIVQRKRPDITLVISDYKNMVYSIASIMQNWRDQHELVYAPQHRADAI